VLPSWGRGEDTQVRRGETLRVRWTGGTWKKGETGGDESMQRDVGYRRGGGAAKDQWNRGRVIAFYSGN